MPATVLIVEDEPDLSSAMTRVLVRAGHHVVSVDTGTAAVAAVLTGEHPVDVVVLDRGLPDISGTDACSQMRAGGFAGAVVVVSGYVGDAHLAACRDAGADDVLAKPFALVELVNRVDDAVSGVRAGASPSPETTRAWAAPQVPVRGVSLAPAGP